jgi:hypothetical protein
MHTQFWLESLYRRLTETVNTSETNILEDKSSSHILEQEFPHISSAAVKNLLPFPSAYLCEADS